MQTPPRDNMGRLASWGFMLRRLGRRKLGAHTEWHQIGRVFLLAATVGIVAGLGAIAFHALCLGITYLSLDLLAGYRPGGPANESSWFGYSDTPFRWWMLLIVPTVGGLVSGWIVYRFAPEAAGPGTGAAIRAFHRERGLIRGRVPLVKMISSAITISTGGSGGREGPIAQIGAGFGSVLATRLKLSDSERRTLMAAGLGAGIGAIFHAPLAGAIFSAEVLYRDPDVEAENILPAFIATTIAYCVFSLATNFEPLFSIPYITFESPLLLLPLAALAAAMVAASLIYTRSLKLAQKLFALSPIPLTLRPMVGAMLTGMVGVSLYFVFAPWGDQARTDVLAVLSFGYGYLQQILNPAPGIGLSAYVVPVLLAVGLGKILTTALTIGSGGSGGVFGPSMVIGGCLGAVVGLLFHMYVPDLVHQRHIVMFVILGMASFFSAAAKTPISTLIMVSELTGGYTLLLPAMWVCAIAYLLSRGWVLYDEQVPGRRDSPAHRGDFVIDVLKGMTVRDALPKVQTQFVSAPIDMPLGEMEPLVTQTRQTTFPVVGPDGQYHGVFSLDDIRQFLYEQGDFAVLAVAHDLADTSIAPLTLQMDLSSAMSHFAAMRFAELPVVDQRDPTKVIGLLRRYDLIATYNAQLMSMKSDSDD